MSSPSETWVLAWSVPIGAALVLVLVATPMLGRKLGYTVDATPSFQLTRAIVESGDLFPEVAVKQGYIYSIAYIPFFVMGYAVAPAFPDVPLDWVQRKLLCWMNIWVTALTLALIVRLLIHLKYRATTAVAVGWMYGFASLAFVYARTDYNKSLGALLVMALFFLWVRWWQTSRMNYALSAGVVAGLLVLLRAELGILVPILSGVMISAVHCANRWKHAAAFVAPVVVASVFFLAYNWVYWQGAASGGYEGGFGLNPFPGLVGFLASPGKSMLVFTPVFFLLPLVIRMFVQRHVGPGVAWAMCVVAIVLLYSFWGNWWGGWGFGPRHLVPLIPLLMLPLAELIEQGTRGHRIILGVLAAAGVLVQLSGTLFDFNDIILMLVRAGAESGLSEPEMMQEIIWNMGTNPLMYHVSAMASAPVERWDIGWVYLAQRFGAGVTGVALLAWIAAIAGLSRWVWLRASTIAT